MRSRTSDSLDDGVTDQMYHLLVQSVVDYAIFLLDAQGHIHTWNAGAERLKGYTREQVVGSHFSIFYGEEDRRAGRPEHGLRMAERLGHWEDEGWRYRSDGSRFWANVVITPLYDDGRLVGFAKVTRDLTERKLAEDEREKLLHAERQARREAELANRAKTDFLATVSHELRTPLNAIAGYVQILEMGVHGESLERQKDALERIRANQQHLLGLIEDLLQFTQIQVHNLPIRRERVPVQDVLRDAAALTLPHVEKAGFVFECALPEPDLAIAGDREKIEQILLNLLSNAAKFTPAGGRVRVAAERVGDCVELSVADTGKGIPEEKLAEIFEPFVQVRDEHFGDSSRQGIGMGLAISRELAGAMDGVVSVESAPGRGSTFILRLPAA